MASICKEIDFIPTALVGPFYNGPCMFGQNLLVNKTLVKLTGTYLVATIITFKKGPFEGKQKSLKYLILTKLLYI